MSSKCALIQAAMGQLAALALPNAKLLGFTADKARPARQDVGGSVFAEWGDAGDPTGVDLGGSDGAVYYYDWAIDLEITPPIAAGLQGRTADEAIDAMGSAIGAAIRADRQLGGLAEWVDVRPLTIDDRVTPGAPTIRTGTTTVIVSFSTTDPLN